MARFLLVSESCEFVDVGFSLTRGRVCHLQLLLTLASAVILSQIRDFPFRPLLHLAGLRHTKIKVKFMLRPTVQSATPFWNKAPILGLRLDLY
jgi:hypothetical protein